MSKMPDLITGSKYNKLTILNKIGSRTSNLGQKRIYYLCQCDCGNLIELSRLSIVSGGTKSCGCLKLERTFNWKGYEEISGVFWGKIRQSAIVRGIDFHIKIEDVWELYLAQNRLCALSGVPIFFERQSVLKCQTHTASLDRIDSSKSYTLDNVQWVHKTANLMKMHLLQDEFIEWCKLISDHSGRKT